MEALRRSSAFFSPSESWWTTADGRLWWFREFLLSIKCLACFGCFLSSCRDGFALIILPLKCNSRAFIGSWKGTRRWMVLALAGISRVACLRVCAKTRGKARLCPVTAISTLIVQPFQGHWEELRSFALPCTRFHVLHEFDSCLDVCMSHKSYGVQQRDPDWEKKQDYLGRSCTLERLCV